jgi:hypothetical protein
VTQLDGVDCRSLHRGGNLESTADLTGTEGSNPAPSSDESAANLTRSIRAPKILPNGLRVASRPLEDSIF